MRGMYSMRSPAVKRLMKEAQELREPTEQYHAQPLEDNLFEWHFTMRGPGESEFDGGLYHGRIILPPEYPMKPPSIILLTPNGRFEVYKKICLSISGHHPESWQPSWSIRTALLAIIGFMPTHGAGAIGSLDYSKEERAKLAKKSLEWKCPTCGQVQDILKPVTSASQQTQKEAKELAAQINFQGEKSTSTSSEPPKSPAPTPSQASTSQTSASTVTSGVTSTTVPPEQPQFTPPFGQFPFGSPYFPYTFPPNSPTGQTSVTIGAMGIPRFPPPPPVIPAMFPPGLMANCGFSGMSQFPNSVFSMPTSVPGTSAPNKQTEANKTDGVQSKSTTKTDFSVKDKTSSGASKEETEVSPCEQITSEAPVTEVESDVAITNSNTTTTTTTEVTEGQTNVTDTTGIRHRAGVVQEPLDEPPYVIPPVGILGQNAELPRDVESRWQLSTVLIVLVSLAIGLLLLRRFILSRTWRFYYGL